MKLIIDTPNYNLKEVQNGSIASKVLLEAIKNGTPYEENPQGKWVMVGTWYDDYDNLKFKCNQCGRIVNDRENYCPKCGADMRGSQ